MTPKQKAEQIMMNLGVCFNAALGENEEDVRAYLFAKSKELSWIIAERMIDNVREILKITNGRLVPYNQVANINEGNLIQYWIDVRTEIEQL